MTSRLGTGKSLTFFSVYYSNVHTSLLVFHLSVEQIYIFIHTACLCATFTRERIGTMWRQPKREGSSNTIFPLWRTISMYSEHTMTPWLEQGNWTWTDHCNQRLFCVWKVSQGILRRLYPAVRAVGEITLRYFNPNPDYSESVYGSQFFHCKLLQVLMS